MKTHYIYDSTTGRIESEHRTVTSPPPTPDEGKGVVSSTTYKNFKLCYVDSQAAIQDKTPANFTPDKSQIIADLVDTATISGIPANTIIKTPDEQYLEINDGAFEFSVDLPGTYVFVIDAVEHLKEEVTIEAIAAS